MKNKKEEKDRSTSKSEYDLRGDPQPGKTRLQELASEIGKSRGRFFATTLDRAASFRIHKIPTGIFYLDLLTHGGIPIDRLTRVYGAKNSCKTTVMLKLLANAQHHCRKCSNYIVVSPDTGEKNCSCPNPRWKLKTPSDIEFLEYEDTVAIGEGNLPGSAKKDHGIFKMEGKFGKKISFEEDYRCQPMQTIFVETEHKLDVKWAERNGVDTGLVIAVGADIGESLINLVERLLYSNELDLVLVDTLSMITPAEDVEKAAEDPKMVAIRARTIGRFMTKVVAAQNSTGVLSDRKLTIMVNSQVRTQGIGGYRTKLGPPDGNLVDHVVALDIKCKFDKYISHNKEYASVGVYSFHVDKNHTGGSSGVGGQFQMWLDPEGPYQVGDTDDIIYVIKYGREQCLIENKSGKYVVQSVFLKDGKASFGTLSDLQRFLKENPTLYYDLRKRLIDCLNGMRTEIKKKAEKEEVPV